MVTLTILDPRNFWISDTATVALDTTMPLPSLSISLSLLIKPASSTFYWLTSYTLATQIAAVFLTYGSSSFIASWMAISLRASKTGGMSKLSIAELNATACMISDSSGVAN